MESDKARGAVFIQSGIVRKLHLPKLPAESCTEQYHTCHHEGIPACCNYCDFAYGIAIDTIFWRGQTCGW